MDWHTGRNRQFPLADLLRQSLYSRLAGLRGFERRSSAISGPDLPAERLGKGLGAVEHHLGELFSRVSFIVTNMTLPSRGTVKASPDATQERPWRSELEPTGSLA